MRIQTCSKSFVIDKNNYELPKLEPNIGVNLAVVGTITFGFNSNTITETSYIVINQIYQLLKQNPHLTLEIGGHTDNIGTLEYNYFLGLKRAKTIRKILIIKGIKQERLTLESYSYKLPIAENNTPEGRSKNRRITFTPLSFDYAKK